VQAREWAERDLVGIYSDTEAEADTGNLAIMVMRQLPSML